MNFDDYPLSIGTFLAVDICTIAAMGAYFVVRAVPYTRSEFHFQAVQDAPGKEEVAFRLLPSSAIAYAIMLIAAALWWSTKSNGVVIPSFCWLLAAALFFWVAAVISASVTYARTFHSKIGLFSQLQEAELFHMHVGLFPDARKGYNARVACARCRSPVGQLISLPFYVVISVPLALWCLTFYLAGGISSFEFLSAMKTRISVGISLIFFYLALSTAGDARLADAVATGGISALIVVAVLIPLNLVHSARLFSVAHAMDDFTAAHVKKDVYHLQLFRQGLVWGLPYAVCLIAAAIFMVAIYRGIGPGAIGYPAVGVGLVVGLLFCLGLTERAHLASNRRAKPLHDEAEANWRAEELERENRARKQAEREHRDLITGLKANLNKCEDRTTRALLLKYIKEAERGGRA